ncbi:MAG: GNAT family N-acetyltransferase [Verrucomicrobiota bacterium]
MPDNAGKDRLKLLLAEPSSKIEWELYFDLRWRVLRAPWRQPRGSEQDEREADSIHLMLCDASRMPFAVGRLHLNSPHEAQIRFMAVDPKVTRQGLGTAVLTALESRAAKMGFHRIVLNARKQAVPFYQKHGYAVTGDGETMFDTVLHVRMAKKISSITA